jgi:DNA polymerase III epsilon subunit-like protein
MLSIGACLVGRAGENFYIELQPISDRFDQKAMEINQLTLDELLQRGVEPHAALQQFANWIRQVAVDALPVFVGFNAAFDWSFINYYFMKFLGHNPFGHTALDIKSFYMAVEHCDWSSTSRLAINPKFLSQDFTHTHNALDDAIEQAAIFEKLLHATFGAEIQ